MEAFQLFKARDPSIVQTIKSSKKSQNICCKNLLPLLCESTNNENNATEVSVESNRTNVEKYFQVYLRLKPDKAEIHNKMYRIQDNSFICQVPASKNPLLRVGHGSDNVEKRFCFDSIFDGSTNQSTIFHECIKVNVLQFINGSNSTLMSYGASGSGKTFTMLGNNKDPGMIPRSLEYIFQTLPQSSQHAVLKPRPDGTLIHLDGDLYRTEMQETQSVLNCLTKQERTNHAWYYKAMKNQLNPREAAIISISPNNIFSLWVSFYEVYNECIYDLLSTEEIKKTEKQPSLRLGRDSEGNTFIRDLTCLHVQSGEQAYELLQYGMHKIKYAATLVNKHSSRSHCILVLQLIQSDKHGNHAIMSKLNFCDLAGSERTKNTRNNGARLVESKNINTSLHVLSRCVNIIHDRQKGVNTKAVVPYRQSKLTQIFKKALSGKETITMMININPSIEMFDITQHVLSFAAIAKSILVIPEEVKSNRRTSKFLEYMKQNQSLDNLQVSAILNTSTHNHNDTQIDLLLDEIEMLKQQLVQKDLVIEHIENAVRQEVSKEYREILSSTQSFWEKRMAAAVESATLMERLQSAYQDEIKQKIDESKDNDDFDDANAGSWEKKYNDLKALYEDSKLELDEYKSANHKLTKECDDLKEILASAQEDYANVLEELNELKAKVVDDFENHELVTVLVSDSDSDSGSGSDIDSDSQND